MQSATLKIIGVLVLVRSSLCDVVCPEVPIIKGGRVDYPPKRSVGSVLHYICDGASRPHPVGFRVCMPSGSWSPLRNVYQESARRASCEQYSCVGPFTLANGHVYPQKTKYKVGDVVRFECHDDYAMFGSLNRTCLPNGEWSGRTTICDMGDTFCPHPGSPVGGQRLGGRFGRGDEVRYTCFQGLVLRGSALRTCQADGQWSGKEPRCEGRYSYDDPERVAKSLSLFEEIMEHAHSGSRIYFLLDASGSVGEANFEKAKDFVLQYTILAQDISKHVSSSVITFASNVHTASNRTSDPAILNGDLEQWKYSDASRQGGTNTGGALQEILDDIKRDDIKRDVIKKDETEKLPKIFIILVTDGKHNTGRSPHELVQEIAAAIPNSERMLDIFSIGIGDAHKEDLEKIASKKEQQRAFYLRDYGTLTAIIEAMRTKGNSNQCGVRGGPSVSLGRIHMGQQAADKQWPWQVVLTTKINELIGGGSIISRRWILTAAHVVMVTNDRKDIHLDQIWVKVGVTDRISGERLAVEEVIVHESYQGPHDGYNYDIALLKLKENLTFSNKIWPICLPCTEDMNMVLSLPQVSEEEKCSYQDHILTGNGGKQEKKISGYVTGWGATEKNFPPKFLMHAEITIETRVNCSTFAKDFTDNKICAIGKQGQDTCTGDSGGPFVVRMNQRWIQVGIVSYGTTEECGKSTVGVYTNVPKMMTWIHSKVGKTGLD